TKDETSGILKSFITEIENQVDHKVKVIRCDNGTEFKNKERNQFCKIKGILRQHSVSRTTQQNGVAERRNKILVEAARTMLADSKLPTTFGTPILSFMRPFGYPVTILNTIDHLGKFDGKADEGFFVGYSLNSKVVRVFNSRTRIVEENLHIRFSESTPNVVDTKASDNACQARKEIEPIKNYILLPLWSVDPPYYERGVMIRNKARLVTQGYTKKEGIYYDEVFTPVAGIEAIRLFLAYASFKDFMVYQMDVKSAFLYGKIEEDVYVCQPLGFEDLDFPDKVYKVEKALYGTTSSS
ncbi:retrovirus-related pol polyprotein from transposon TNT 1-94, partial [Tanacetum coccineum]